MIPTQIGRSTAATQVHFEARKQPWLSKMDSHIKSIYDTLKKEKRDAKIPVYLVMELQDIRRHYVTREAMKKAGIEITPVWIQDGKLHARITKAAELETIAKSADVAYLGYTEYYTPGKH